MALETHEGDILGLVDHQHHLRILVVLDSTLGCGIAAQWTGGARRAEF